VIHSVQLNLGRLLACLGEKRREDFLFLDRRLTGQREAGVAVRGLSCAIKRTLAQKLFGAAAIPLTATNSTIMM